MSVLLFVFYGVVSAIFFEIMIDSVIPHFIRIYVQAKQDQWERDMKVMDRMRRDNYGPYLDYLFALTDQTSKQYILETFGMEVTISSQNQLYRCMEIVFREKLLKIKYNQNQFDNEQKVYEEEPGLFAEIMTTIKQFA